MIRTIYHFVQGRSLRYPLLSADDVYKHVFVALDFQSKSFGRATFDQWLTGDVLRYQFIEFFVKIAHHQKQYQKDTHTSVLMRNLMTTVV